MTPLPGAIPVSTSPAESFSTSAGSKPWVLSNMANAAIQAIEDNTRTALAKAGVIWLD